MHHKDQHPKLTSSVIVISPLVSLMKSQVLKLKSLGLTAVYLSDIKFNGQEQSEEISVNDIHAGKFDVLLCSPESILGDHRNIVGDLSKKGILRALFIDEAHCITKL